MIRITLLLAAVATCVTAAEATIYLVEPDGSGDYPTIRAALEAAQSGDVIELGSGVFIGEDNRDLDFLGKAITLRSQTGDPDSCIIDCQGSSAERHRAFVFESGEDSTSRVENITMTHAYQLEGGAVYCFASSPTFSGCDFQDNEARGGACLYCSSASPRLEGCSFEGNSSDLNGGAIYFFLCPLPRVVGCTFTNNAAGSGGAVYERGSAPWIESCVFVGNSALSGGAVRTLSTGGLHLERCHFEGNMANLGGVIDCDYSDPSFDRCTMIGNVANSSGACVNCYNSGPLLLNCTLYANSAPRGGGISCGWESAPVLEHSIIAFSVRGEAIYCGSESCAPQLSCCDLFGNGGDWVTCIADQLGSNGNVCENPLFCDAAGGDLGLQPSSPCAPSSPPDSECDQIGAWPVACEDHLYACCLDAECQLLVQDDCATAGGTWQPGAETCEPNPCVNHTYLVRSDGTGDYPTIQTAIDAAMEGDTIELADGVYTGDGNRDIYWSGKAITVRSQSGNPQACVLDCEGSISDLHRAFTLIALPAEASLEGITITHGCAEYYGGGIYAAMGSPSLLNCRLVQNSASTPGPPAFGGGLYAYWCDLRAIGCVFTENIANFLGAGAYCESGGTPYFESCEFSSNSDKGGLVCRNVGATVQDCVFRANTGNDAGGLQLEGDLPCAVSGCLFEGNTGYYGGGLSVEGEATVEDCIVRDNRGDYGGGIYCNTDAAVLFTNCWVSANEGAHGGGVACTHGSPSFVHCTLTDNHARETGGGFYLSTASPRVELCTLVGNDSWEEGGGIYCNYSASPVLMNTIIAFGPDGEAVSADHPTCEPSLSCCDLYENAGGDWVGYVADQYGINGNIAEHPQFCSPANGDFSLHETSPCSGGDIPACGQVGAWPVGCGPATFACCDGQDCQLLLEDECSQAGGDWLLGISTCDPNPCMPCLVMPDGSGDYPTIQDAIDAAAPNGIVHLADGVFTGDRNRDLDFRGKDVTVRSLSGNPELCIIDCEGSGSDRHRGFFLHGGESRDAVIDGVTVSNGYHYEASGAYLWDASPTMHNCVLQGNQYSRALTCMHNAMPLVEDCWFIGNGAGGVSSGDGSLAEFVGCTFAQNSAQYGGAASCSGNSAQFVRCTMADNHADYGSGISLWNQGSPTLDNVIIAFNTGGEALHCNTYYGPCDPQLTCCDVFGNTGGDWTGCIESQFGLNGNFSEDPLFCSEEHPTRPYTLAGGSPCAQEHNPECGQIGAWPLGCLHPSCEDETTALPGHFALHGFAPNPVTSTTQIRFDLPQPAAVSLAIVDVGGRVVRMLLSGEPHRPGRHSLEWQGDDHLGDRLPAGIYFCRLVAGTEMETRRILLTP